MGEGHMLSIAPPALRDGETNVGVDSTAARESKAATPDKSCRYCGSSLLLGLLTVSTVHWAGRIKNLELSTFTWTP